VFYETITGIVRYGAHAPRLPAIKFFNSLQSHTKSITADYLVSYPSTAKST